jgi:hypothetical protein
MRGNIITGGPVGVPSRPLLRPSSTMSADCEAGYGIGATPHLTGREQRESQLFCHPGRWGADAFACPAAPFWFEVPIEVPR